MVTTQRRIALLFAGLVPFAPLPAPAADEIFRLIDARGDDSGAGDLVYPNREDFQVGSLDLEWLTASAADDGTWFSARMGGEIVSPRSGATGVGSQPLTSLARHGFYTFNIDVYIDTDSLAGSGNTATLPGRGVAVDPDNAWEKAVILTPRPEIARAWYALHRGHVREADVRALEGKVERDDLAVIDAEIAREIEREYYFSDRIRVRGREIEFFVPDAFLGGTARADWAYTVIVTAADVEQAGRLLKGSQGGFKLMAMSAAPGRAGDRLGIVNGGDINQPPVIDLLAHDVETQRRALSDYDAAAPRYAAVPGIVPSSATAAARAPAASTAAPATGAPPSSSAPPAANDARAAEPSAAAQPRAAGGPNTLPSRLRTLNELKEEGLISAEEYEQTRRKILAEL